VRCSGQETSCNWPRTLVYHDGSVKFVQPVRHEPTKEKKSQFYVERKTRCWMIAPH